MDTFERYPVMWEAYFGADKDPVSVLRASATWISAPVPVDVTLAGAS